MGLFCHAVTAHKNGQEAFGLFAVRHAVGKPRCIFHATPPPVQAWVKRLRPVARVAHRLMHGENPDTVLRDFPEIEYGLCDTGVQLLIDEREEVQINVLPDGLGEDVFLTYGGVIIVSPSERPDLCLQTPATRTLDKAARLLLVSRRAIAIPKAVNRL